jgi:hypothetical protein
MSLNVLSPRLFVILMLGLQTGYSQIANSQQPLAPAWSDEVIYSHLFRHVNTLERQANERQQREGSGEPFRHYFRGKLNLSPSQELDLKYEAQQYAAEIAPVQAEIAARIRAFRERYPKGLTAKENLPPGPPDLRDLTAKKSEILQRHIASWRTSVGRTESVRLEATIKAFISSGLQQITLTHQSTSNNEEK